MQLLYTLLLYIVQVVLYLVKGTNEKLRLFVEGRKSVYADLQNLPQNRPVLWFHCASLGEYEQAVPIMKAIREQQPEYVLLVTFFSPSGYEVKKKADLPDIVTYLPLDIPYKVNQFLNKVRPELAFFVKYEFWPNYMMALQSRSIPLYSISGVFRKDQVFFKFYGGFMRKALQTITYFFVQDENSLINLKELNITNTTVSGDTRYDRVAAQLNYDNQIEAVERFIRDRQCIVFGSTWPEDEAILINFVRTLPKNTCCVIAPHEVKSREIERLQRIFPDSCLFTDLATQNGKHNVLIVNTIGHLSKIYSYADIAYVGGAMGTSGLHNILEPATFGVPVIIGKNFQKFPEAQQLLDAGGLVSVSTPDSFENMATRLLISEEQRKTMADASYLFVQQRKGATQIIIDHVFPNSEKTV